MSTNNILSKNIKIFETHPFLKKAKNGSLTEKQVISWIMCAGRESRAFPEIIKNMIQWVNNENIKSILIDNLNDEYGNGNPNEAHFMHYIQLLNKINLTEQDFLDYKDKEGVKFAVSLAYNVSNSEDIGFVLGYMLLNEALTPIIYSAIQDAMKKYYPNLNTDFFDIHIKVDEHHVEELFKAIENLTEKELESIQFGIELGQRGMSVILDESLGVFDVIDNIPTLSLDINK